MENHHDVYLSGCRKTPQKTDETEQQGVCAGGKKPTARSIKQDFETFFESFKIRTAWRKDFFDTLKGAVSLRASPCAKCTAPIRELCILRRLRAGY